MPTTANVASAAAILNFSYPNATDKITDIAKPLACNMKQTHNFGIEVTSLGSFGRNSYGIIYGRIVILYFASRYELPTSSPQTDYLQGNLTAS